MNDGLLEGHQALHSQNPAFTWQYPPAAKLAATTQ
jgi:hypothetical protein